MEVIINNETKRILNTVIFYFSNGRDFKKYGLASAFRKQKNICIGLNTMRF